MIPSPGQGGEPCRGGGGGGGVHDSIRPSRLCCARPKNLKHKETSKLGMRKGRAVT